MKKLNESKNKDASKKATPQKIRATTLARNLYFDIEDFKGILNNYEILGVIETIKAKFIHDLAKSVEKKEKGLLTIDEFGNRIYLNDK
jgi:hypothetical protein